MILGMTSTSVNEHNIVYALSNHYTEILLKKLHYTIVQLVEECFVARLLLGALKDIGTVESSIKCISISEEAGRMRWMLDLCVYVWVVQVKFKLCHMTQVLLKLKFTAIDARVIKSFFIYKC